MGLICLVSPTLFCCPTLMNVYRQFWQSTQNHSSCATILESCRSCYKAKKVDPLFSVERPYIKHMCAYSLYIWNLPHIVFFLYKNLHIDCIAHSTSLRWSLIYVRQCKTMIFLLMISYWMQKSRQNFPNFTITMWYRGPTSFKCVSATMQLVLTITHAWSGDNQFLSDTAWVKLTVSFTTTKG